MRCLLAPILSGGAVVAMPYFDPDYFWSVVEMHRVTWYYAVPTIHASILAAFSKNPRHCAKSLSLIWNAGGPIPHSQAVAMRDAYSSTTKRTIIMPSYGMTECMPIAAPPDTYNLEKPGSSGLALGPQLQVSTLEENPVVSTAPLTALRSRCKV